MMNARRKLVTRVCLATAVVMGSTVLVSSVASAGTVHEYSLTFTNGASISGSSADDNITVANVGGASTTSPTGMKIKINCDDTFPGGWGAKEGPKLGIDSAWQVDSYAITKYKDGRIDKRCSGTDLSADLPAGDFYDYSFTFANGTTIDGLSRTDNPVRSDVGGTSVTNPSGMKIKINCDDTFPGGWGAKEGPKLGIDTAWQVDSYTIVKYKDRKIDKQCSDTDLTSEMPAGDFYDYSFTFANGTTIDGLSRTDNPVRSDVGGTSVTNPSGMKIKINCDDTFPGGWGAKEGPKLGIDTAWQVDSYTIVKYKDGTINKQCSGDDLTSPSSAPANGYAYEFTFVNGVTLTGTSPSNTAFVAGAGGTDVDNPTGMTVHISCSDPYPNGWGEKDGPKETVDTAWQVESYRIVKYKDGAIEKTCGDSFVPPEPAGVPAVDIEMSVNGEDADAPPGVNITLSANATFSYVVTNTGETSLTEIVVTDDDRGTVTCPYSTLTVGESMDCSSITETQMNAGPHDGNATVVAVGPSVTPGVTDPVPASGSGILYSFTFVNGQTLTGAGPANNTLFLAGAGGTSVDNPTGMNVHVSCSDPYPDGWGAKDGPKLGVDTAWQLASYQIVKYKDGAIDKTCGSDSVPVPTVVTDSDPVNYYVIGNN